MSPFPPTAEPIRIVIADDHAVVRSGLRLLLESEPDFRVVAEVGDGDAAYAEIAERHPQVAVLDFNMPGARTTLELISALTAEEPGTAVVVLTMLSDPGFARASLRAGAVGYVVKDAADHDLVEAVRRAAGGWTYVTPALGAQLALLQDVDAGPPDSLTEREAEVLGLIASGHTNLEISGLLGLSVRTVESHRAHIQQKLRRSTRAELVRYALDHGMLQRFAP